MIELFDDPDSGGSSSQRQHPRRFKLSTRPSAGQRLTLRPLSGGGLDARTRATLGTARGHKTTPTATPVSRSFALGGVERHAGIGENRNESRNMANREAGPLPEEMELKVTGGMVPGRGCTCGSDTLYGPHEIEDRPFEKRAESRAELARRVSDGPKLQPTLLAVAHDAVRRELDTGER